MIQLIICKRESIRECFTRSRKTDLPFSYKNTISISFQINERKSVIPSRVHWKEIEGIQNGSILVSDLDLSSLKIAVFQFVPVNLEIM